MALFNFYINDEERIELINFILIKGTKIIPDVLNEIKEYKTLKNIDDFKKCMKNKDIRYFLLDSSYVTEDLDFLEIIIDNNPRYKISQRVGGPAVRSVLF